MSEWGSCKARTLYRALLGIGWSLKREGKGSHRILEHSGFPDFTFAFHDSDEISYRSAVPTPLRIGPYRFFWHEYFDD
jgi:predicted RNA binding protein YcfA (HicA-like mRNA interferase family)